MEWPTDNKACFWVNVNLIFSLMFPVDHLDWSVRVDINIIAIRFCLCGSIFELILHVFERFVSFD